MSQWKKIQWFIIIFVNKFLPKVNVYFQFEEIRLNTYTILIFSNHQSKILEFIFLISNLDKVDHAFRVAQRFNMDFDLFYLISHAQTANVYHYIINLIPHE